MLGYPPVSNDRSFATRAGARRPLLKRRSSDSKYSSKTQVARELRVVQVHGGMAAANRHIQNLEAHVRSAHARAGSVCPVGVRY